MSRFKSKKKTVIKIITGLLVTGSVLLFIPTLFLDKAEINNVSNSATSQLTNQNDSIIEMAGYQVPVTKDGLYEKFRSNSPLSVIHEEYPGIDLSWFETLKKERKDVGFITYSPNFYYSNSSITAIYTADMKTISELIPKEVRNLVQPISFTPGRGLIAITSYAYHLCDNDSYNELSISIVTTKPNAKNWGLISLMGELNEKSLWGFVLKLPVNTELARVRGVVGYNLPKWLIPIDYNTDGENVTFTYFDEKGNFDFSMKGKKLETKNTSPQISRLNFVNLDVKGQPTHGHSDIRSLKSASSKNSEDIQLDLSDGPISTFIKSLDLKKLVRYDYQPEFQAALYTPEKIDRN